METLARVVASMQEAAVEAGIKIVAGDTKVVEKGKADGLFINTAGLGWIPEGREIGGDRAQPGDAVLISGSVGDHGIAVLAARGELGFETGVRSDVAPLNALVRSILAAAPNTHVLRDPTRGGLATTLNEIAGQSQVSMWLEEKSIPVKPAVQAACEMLGFDPLYVANEGKVIVVVPESEAGPALNAMRQHPYGAGAERIGTVQASPAGRVLLRTLIGGTRILDLERTTHQDACRILHPHPHRLRLPRPLRHLFRLTAPRSMPATAPAVTVPWPPPAKQGSPLPGSSSKLSATPPHDPPSVKILTPPIRSISPSWRVAGYFLYQSPMIFPQFVLATMYKLVRTRSSPRCGRARST